MSTVVFIHANQEVIPEVNPQLEPARTQSPPIVAICSHVKDNGVRCGIPALKERDFCYFHARAHARGPRVGERGYRAPLAETIESLQLKVQHASEALASGRINERVAGKLLYSVQLSMQLLNMKMKMKQQSSSNRGTPVAPDRPATAPSADVPLTAALPSSNNQLSSYPDNQIDLVVTEIPAAMQEALLPIPLTGDNPEDPAALFDCDPDMPSTVEQAQRALLPPERLLSHLNQLEQADRLSSRYQRLERRIRISKRALGILEANGLIDTGVYYDGMGICGR